ncbi:Hypothetical protein SMAX5B_018585 [Scophthalmus maximus]|uniref:Uncharacterized protein n=1 Tax=Scophthalmus maximus TaxID=52904 RepID=A0A2U9CB56_SCOMX|nr:Hypothetical protein SMAX5B_018585 [Scophthalmus maximus]
MYSTACNYKKEEEGIHFWKLLGGRGDVCVWLFYRNTSTAGDDSPVSCRGQLAVDEDELGFQRAVQVSVSRPSAE